jgi:hypothetical protein
MMDERFTDRARKVMQLANQEAQRLDHDYIGTEHILLGLVKEEQGVAAFVLREFGLDKRTARLEVERAVGVGRHRPVMGKLPMTPRARKVIDLALEEARNLNHHTVGTEHLLLGLLREEEGAAVQVLMACGFQGEDVRREVLDVLSCSCQELLDVQGHSGPCAEVRALPREPLGSRIDGLERRLHAVETRLAGARLLLGALAGLGAGLALAGATGAVLGLVVGGLLAAAGRLIPSVVAGGTAGAALGANHLTDGGGWITGGLIGAFLAACVVEVGRTSVRRCRGRR